MKYPHFRFKIMLNMTLVVTMSILLGFVFQQYTYIMLYGWPGLQSLIRLLFLSFSSTVLPPLIIMGTIIYIYILPLHRVVYGISKGIQPSEKQYFHARKRLIGLDGLTLILTVGGFLIGNLMGSLGTLQQFLSFEGIGGLLQQIFTGLINGFIIISINNIILAKPRAMLKIYYLDEKHIEKNLSLKNRNTLLGFCLAVYLLLTMAVFNQHVLNEQSMYIHKLESVLLGEKSIEEVAEEYHSWISNNPGIPNNLREISFPIETGERRMTPGMQIQLVFSIILALIAFIVHYTTWTSQTKQLILLKKRLKEIADGGGGLSERLEIIQFDEMGELVDNTNRLMDKIADRNRAEREIRMAKAANETSLNIAQRLTGLGSFDITLPDGECSCSVEFSRMTGINPSVDIFTLDTYVNWTHPDAKEMVDTALKGALKGKGSFFIPEHPITTRNLGERIVQMQGEVHFDEDGNPARLFGAVLDITNLKIAERELLEKESKLRAAESASHAKSAFLANMSHELRTPLNSVIAASDILLEKYFGDLTLKQEDYLKDILESGHHLLSLINDILDLSKVEAGHNPLELNEMDLHTLLKGSLSIVKEKAFKHKIDLSCHTESNVPIIIADERKIKQVVYNLLSNAVKFTPDGGEVGIDAILKDNLIFITVWDTGIGITDKDLDLIFGEFSQAEETLTKRYEGTGLGLALVKKFVEQHGGEIKVESKADSGSRFTFTLPVRIRPEGLKKVEGGKI
jgi:signal transduction histidine kinase